MKITKLLSIAALFVAALFSLPETSEAEMSNLSCKTKCNRLACAHDPELATKCKKECPADTVKNCKASAKKVAKSGKLSAATCTLKCTAKNCGKNPSLAQQCIHSCPEDQVTKCAAAHKKAQAEEEDGEEEAAQAEEE
ncbi:MAG: hypothetical protein J0G29_04335 [Alphaproteobacteria bacterium]|nr:hypothetical protein [Alphaproteobacteria bacterium]OJV47557.1 MAG: hypothetical protein BGO28_06905 [Alphaproteobacteria bacterium 43-37]